MSIEQLILFPSCTNIARFIQDNLPYKPSPVIVVQVFQITIITFQNTMSSKAVQKYFLTS